MAFTDPATSVWNRASLLNEIVDGINDRAPVAGSAGRGWYPIDTVVAQVDPVHGTHVQRASFWANLQQACEDLISDGNWAVAHNAGALIGATPAAVFDGTAPDTAIGAYANIGEVSTAMGVSFWRARTGSGGWNAAGQTAEHDVLNNHLVTDLQSVLKALIWTKHAATWETSIKGLGADFANATKDGAMTAAIADYATPSGAALYAWPHGEVGYEQPGAPGAYDGWASRRKSQGQIADCPIDRQCDIYWFAYIEKAANEWSAQGTGLSEDEWKHWLTENNVTPANATRATADYFCDADFANSPTDKPDTTPAGAGRGWEASTGEDCAVIDWRDSITYYD